MDDITQHKSSIVGSAKIVYILYIVAVFIGLAGIIGVIIAYVNRDDAPEWLKSHYQFQIRTFWIGALYMIVGGILSLIFIGWLILLFWVIWLIVRSVKGLKLLDMKQAHPNPTTWFFN